MLIINYAISFLSIDNVLMCLCTVFHLFTHQLMTTSLVVNIQYLYTEISKGTDVSSSD